MFKSLPLLIIAALAVSVRADTDPSTAASDVLDISVAGDQTRTLTSLTPLGPITPDISVVGPQTSTVPDVSVVGGWTSTVAAPATTQTQCYQVVETGGVTSSISAQPTFTGTTNPSGYECFLIYAAGGGTVHLPLADAAPAPATINPVIAIGLPVILSLLGVAAILGAGFVFMRIRARRAAASQRTWVDRPGGWVSENAAGKMESGAATY